MWAESASILAGGFNSVPDEDGSNAMNRQTGPAAPITARWNHAQEFNWRTAREACWSTGPAARCRGGERPRHDGSDNRTGGNRNEQRLKTQAIDYGASDDE